MFYLINSRDNACFSVLRHLEIAKQLRKRIRFDIIRRFELKHCNTNV